MRVRKPLRFEMSTANTTGRIQADGTYTIFTPEGFSAQMRLSRASKTPEYLLVGKFFKFNGKLPRFKLLLEFYRRS